MQFCPLCMQNGIRNKMKAFQINLEETIWSCENIKCIWPFGYQDLMFFQRSAISHNWNEPDITKEYTPTLTELSLYTPPMTPRGEALECVTSSTMENQLDELFSKNETVGLRNKIADCNKPHVISELANNNFAKEKDININTDKLMPKIINIEKVNIDITKIFEDNNVSNKRTQEHPISAMGPVKNYGTSLHDANSAMAWCNASNSHTPDKTEKEQNERNNVQTDEVTNYFGTSANINVSSATNEKVNIGIMNNSNTTILYNSILDNTNANDSNIDELLDDVLNDTSDYKNIYEDWIDLIDI
ncbi:superoxide-generating NADPH oxidase heavy chain subunit C [Harpegnathos saltator]|nr:superoxide-generating NADPH oxidase heavy chain subunit C [Harpegnathos saltator]